MSQEPTEEQCRELAGTCAACGEPAEGNYSIHQDGMDQGPEVPLCDACGSDRTPTAEQLWAMIKARRK